MWRKIPLNIKIIVVLLFVECVLFTLATGWLIRWNQHRRLSDLHHQVNVQADFIEDLVEAKDGFIVLGSENEFRRELDHDNAIYFMVTDTSGVVLDYSSGVPEDIRSQLNRNILNKTYDASVTRFSIARGETWLIKSEPVERNRNGVRTQAITHIAINVQNTLTQIKRFTFTVIAAALILAICSAVATALVVSYSTRTLRRFSFNLRTMNPLSDDVCAGMIPSSRDEVDLLDSYEKMTQRLKENIAGQRLFIANASHELKTPIANALLICDVTLNRNRSPDDYKAALIDLQREMNVLRRLSNSLLGLANLDRDVSSEDPGSSDLVQLVTLITERWQSAARAKGISIEGVDLEPLTLIGDPEKWEIILGNLLDNAIKYGREGGYVRISLKRVEAGRVTLSFEDNGIGMSRENLNRLGNIFFRADSSRSKNDSFGIGFAHAKRILEMFGGSLTVESEEGRFTRITLEARTRAIA